MTELQNTNDTSKQRLTQEELSSALAYFTGTEKWYRHIMNKQVLWNGDEITCALWLVFLSVFFVAATVT